jgi:hypothetical protein
MLAPDNASKREKDAASPLKLLRDNSAQQQNETLEITPSLSDRAEDLEFRVRRDRKALAVRRMRAKTLL